MNHDTQRVARWHKRTLSRRAMLRGTAATGALALAAAALPAEAMTRLHAVAGGAELQPLAPIPALVTAIERYPLVAVAELHFMQEWHDFMHALLFHPTLPGALTHIVVEFGNALYQDAADRFIVGDQPVARRELEPIWRFQGWDAPVYEQFFRTVRAVNWMRPRERRIRVLLGAPPFDVPAVRSAADQAFRRWWQDSIDAHYVEVVEREVLARGGHALLIAGGGHTLRGLQRDGDPRQLNAAGLLARRHPGALFVVDTVALPAGAQQDAAGQRLQAAFARWPRPALARLAGTWLGATTQRLDGGRINSLADRAFTPAEARYSAQADAILYLGSGEALTASQADPEIFQYGRYHAQLERLNPIVSQIDGQHEDLIAESVQWAEAGPGWFQLFG